MKASFLTKETILDYGVTKRDFPVFNVGDTNENYTKKMLVDEINSQLPNANISYVKKNEDPRDYRVSFEKINRSLNFTITKAVPEGIEQVIRVVKDEVISNPEDPKYKNI